MRPTGNVINVALPVPLCKMAHLSVIRQLAHFGMHCDPTPFEIWKFEQKS